MTTKLLPAEYAYLAAQLEEYREVKVDRKREMIREAAAHICETMREGLSKEERSALKKVSK